MIIIKLQGGMGNQMFQYALGRKLSIQNNDVFKLDLSSYKTDKKRVYEIGVYNVVENFASEKEIERLELPFGPISKAINVFKKKALRIFNIEFKPAILRKKGDMYLDGFWQSEKYFADIRDVLLKDFTLKNGLRQSLNPIIEDIKKSNSVSIFVRRGDYVKEKKTGAYFGLCSPEYYEKAIALLKEKIGPMKLFVFSDDIVWVKENMHFDFPVVFVSEYVTPKEEISMMALCKNNIIANSSFSWWGAWLNTNPQKIVIAPSRWQIKAVHRTKDIVPDSWIRI